ncbi:MAG: aminotransferase class III-fold pyridoxal phosphate-dependent enzyme [Pseudomonadales bacterium]|nr:aminotransferase class III-fold pyridoxal phosphate-dependent enzyme [Pseudomonadales bacterium]
MNDLWPFLPGRDVPRVDRAEGAVLYDDRGREIIDAAAGAIVVNIGHGREEVAEAVARETRERSYVLPPWSTPSRERLVTRLREKWLPEPLDRAYFASGGSEANETAIKVAVQHFAAQGQPERHKIVGRSLSYHGTTIATTAVGGHAARRVGLERILQGNPKAPTPYPLRCPLGSHHPDAGRHYVDALAATIEAAGPDSIAALIAEPIVGSSGGAIVPPDDYWPAVRELCDEHGILLILDEVMTGFGRTGPCFAGEHWGITPDILVSGKGLAGGYAPIGGVFTRSDVLMPIVDAGAEVMFHTFGAHPAACAAADVVLDILEREDLLARAAARAARREARLTDAFADQPPRAEVRGRGMLRAIEVVADRETLMPFPAEARLTQEIVAEGLERGVYFYWGGTGEIRDIICLGPPFVINDVQLDRTVDVLREAVDAAVARCA